MQTSPNSPNPDISRLVKWLRVLMTVTLAIVVASAAAFLYLSSPNQRITPYGTRLVKERAAFDFTLVDQNNQTRRLSEFRGKAVYLFFGFVNCPDVCPTTLTELKKVYQTLTPAEQSKVRVLLITTDPERDTPEVLGRYVAFFDPSFLGLTGTPQQIAEAAKGYGVFYIKSNIKSATEYNVDHTATTFLVDPQGRLRLLYANGRPANTERMLEDLRWVLRSRG
ncbi:SCO family protein [Meiothermus granaticius]|uniref:SCO1 protein n=1 Tax=Meiothermus granaticius NBRC 107808 TaxID=1227551 RepID=A0A399FA79_9DEIN|nr:SCO family protein [Meiothermus granaticius]RIH93494.1 SCO1 protein [Meiothermus granaticius NBRC 107808]GEM85989.1 electron transporter [Meiothermus granaticius NBRC 107808]